MSYQFIDGNTHALHQHMRHLDAQQREDDWLDEEMERIYASIPDLGAACLDANPDMKISEAVAMAAQRRLELMKESRDEI
jgi:hypothetical protein